jgi:general secretion pathway protein F
MTVANFRYKALTQTGAVIRGNVEAQSAAVVVQQLRGQGHFPISAAPANANSVAERFLSLLSARKPSLSLIGTATSELAALLNAGLELDRALSILCRLSDIGTLKAPLERVRNSVRDGMALADALAREEVFPQFYVSMIRSGEYAGTLAPTMQKLADYLARTAEVRDAVTSALVYPAIVATTAAVSVSIIVFFVLPEFKPLFEQAGATIPLPARIVMGLSDFVRATWWIFALLIAGAFFGAREWLSKPANGLRLDAALLGLPLFGRLLQAQGTERFSRTLGMLLSNGVPLPNALVLTKDVMQNRVMADAVAEAAASLREGESLAHLLAQSKRFPDVTVDLVRIGEETGKLPEMLLKQAELEEHRLRHTIDRLVALIVPALTIVMGIVVAGLIASMLIAILSVNDLAMQ